MRAVGLLLWGWLRGFSFFALYRIFRESFHAHLLLLHHNSFLPCKPDQGFQFFTINKMGGSSQAKEYPNCYFLASSFSAMINYPLWRASAVGQSGFNVSVLPNNFAIIKPIFETIPVSFKGYVHAFVPPYKGFCATIIGMTWARTAIFWGSDYGKEMLQSNFPYLPTSVVTLAPPLVTSVFVQCVNQPVVRASITLQNPESELKNIRQSIKVIYSNYGIKGLWHGTSAGILKTVPKYCTAVIVKDYMEYVLPKIDQNSETAKSDNLYRSACKSAAAGIAGALLTNPLDVIRNEMFKTNLPLFQTVQKLKSEFGWKFMNRGLGKNLVAVSIPVSTTIFFTDIFIQISKSREEKSNII